MMRNLRFLGVAVFAVLAMSAVSASFASAAADDLTAEQYPVTLTGKNDPNPPILKTTAGSYECTTSTLHATVSGPTTTVSATPTYSGCTCIGVACTIDMNGCTYLIHMTEGTTSTVDIVCPAGQEITLTNSKCILHVPPQTGLPHIVWTNVGAGATREITGHVTISGLRYKHTEGSGIGKCTSGEGTNGTLDWTVVVTGETDPTGAAHIGIFLS